MPKQFDPYTVSAVVDTTTGALLTPPQVRPGYVDYLPNTTAQPRDPAHQFRWVHVLATSPAAAVRANALTADLRPGSDRQPPVARAWNGPAGLKRYTVTVAIHRRTHHRVGEPVVTDGHVRLAIPTPRGTRQQSMHLWARDRQAAVGRVVGTARAYSPHEVAHNVAEQRWRQMDGRPTAERITAVTDDVWRHAYMPVYRAAYDHTASTIAAGAAAATRDNPAARTTLHQLAEAAGGAIRQLPRTPPADQAALDAAVHAVSAPGDLQPPWRRVADATLNAIKGPALLHGAAAAAIDTMTGWRARNGDILADQVSINGQPASEWVTTLVSQAGGITSVTPRRGHCSADTGRTAAHLAHQDQAPSAAVPSPQAPGNRRRPSHPPPTASAGPRRSR